MSTDESRTRHRSITQPAPTRGGPTSDTGFTTRLWFDTDGEAAANVFKNSRIPCAGQAETDYYRNIAALQRA
ncbi:MAG TPA: hypothetical protein VGR98_15415 [Streptosporangiaceae bacterium]|nr:hypothetical protein [Streptosporangiaceae bacterium]